MTTEQQVIEQLSQYRQKKARIQALSTYSVGAGITVSRLNEDDQLQELHRKLRGLPSYMYLSGYEQKLENVAHAYMTQYPAGVKSQMQAIPVQVLDPEDTELLQELRGKIQRVIAARGYEIREGIEEIIERLTELQNLQAEVERIEAVLDALEQYKPDYAKIIWLHIIDSNPWENVTEQLNLSRPVFYRWRKKAIAEYERLAK
ncbi:RNA polymerase subunit sigma-24 [Paenibacillus sp. Cedars]|uniref:RNA polymerase subunit sigma-24 n=1 Tax=Paenibacillus sp. Cedars TaxID=1980674 RepID=UPI001162B8B9|nr:RNA polymerase subunit sigma-24 [Paenibacillus sp. Cedars]AWP28731.1 RNA polymerase subunit sigma-24 [Paenibacillus sp. Cedars]